MNAHRFLRRRLEGPHTIEAFCFGVSHWIEPKIALEMSLKAFIKEFLLIRDQFRGIGSPNSIYGLRERPTIVLSTYFIIIIITLFSVQFRAVSMYA